MTNIRFTKKHLSDFEDAIRKHILPYGKEPANALYNEVLKTYNKIIIPHCNNFVLPLIPHGENFFDMPPVQKEQ